MSDEIDPTLKTLRLIAKMIFALTTWAVCIIFVIDFWPYISKITVRSALLSGGVCLGVTAFSGFLLITRAVTLESMVKFFSVVFFFLSLAGLYSYVGYRLGTIVKNLIPANPGNVGFILFLASNFNPLSYKFYND